ncbi:MAG: NAD(+)/NADH kinase [Nitrospirae bacterium]|nr:MAG: NAD(+)/NADH kinase [Nitrospirota bacterium]
MFTTVGILTKPQFTDIQPVLARLVGWLRSHQKQVILSPETASLLNESTPYQFSDLATLTDLMIVLGGDGTMLSAARLVEERSVPILGVNMGGLGFLTETTVDCLFESLEKVFSQDYYLDTRLRLQSHIYRQARHVAQATALNDVVLSKGTLGRMITVHIQIDKRFVSNLRGDGIIIASPTGSTAYSLSAGGPILDPSLEVLVITPISPHTLTHRPLLVPSRAQIEIRLTSPHPAIATLDGQVGFELQGGDTLTVSMGIHRTRLIRFPDRSYYDILRAKLKWGDG